MTDVVTPEHRELALGAREVLASYRESADLIEVGAYAAGSNPRVDRAIACRDGLATFLKQRVNERASLADTLGQLRKALGAAAPAEGRHG